VAAKTRQCKNDNSAKDDYERAHSFLEPTSVGVGIQWRTVKSGKNVRRLFTEKKQPG
jgi:hypothetical protein